MKYLSIPCVLLVTGITTAQDMPLHEIIKPGEGWKAAGGEMPKRPSGGYSVDAKSHSVLLDGKPIQVPLEQSDGVRRFAGRFAASHSRRE